MFRPGYFFMRDFIFSGKGRKLRGNFDGAESLRLLYVSGKRRLH